MTETAAPEQPAATDEEVAPTGTVSAWKEKRVHKNVTLPSGAKVSITLPNLAQMIKSGTIPNALIDDALEHRNEAVTRESLLQTWAFARFIVPRAVVQPEITEDDVDDLPIQDVEMIAGFAGRTNDIDAVGHHLGGLESVRSFRSHRGLLGLDEIVGGA